MAKLARTMLGEQEIVRFGGQRIIHRFHLPVSGGRQKLVAGRALDQHGKVERFLDAGAGRQETVVRQQDAALVAQRRGDDLAFLVGDGQAGPFLQVGAVVVERRRVHVRDHQRLARHGQGRDMRRCVWMMHCTSGAAGTPRNESARRVGRAGSVQHFHVLVDADDRGRDDLVERVGHGCRQERAVVLAHGDLAREGFRMAFAGENAAAQGHLFLLVPVSEVELVRGARKEGVGMGLFFQHGVSLGIMAPLHARPAAARLTDHERRLTPCDSTGALPAVAGQYDRVFRACHEPARPCLRPPGPPGPRRTSTSRPGSGLSMRRRWPDTSVNWTSWFCRASSVR